MNLEDPITRWSRVRNAVLPLAAAGVPWETGISHLVDAIWSEFGGHRPVSWVGFYYLGDDEMTLGPRRDKPACSPIGLHGACGQVALSGRSLVVPDVRLLGDNYIACDPRDLAELVVPVRNGSGKILGVMDLDSYAVGAFHPDDLSALENLIEAIMR